MRKVRCTKGHFFDAEMSNVCPHCGAPEAIEGQNTVMTQEESDSSTKSKKGLFGRKKTIQKDEKNSYIVTEEDLRNSMGEVEKTGSIFGYEDKKPSPAWSIQPEEIPVEKERVIEEPCLPLAKSFDRDIDSVKTVSKYADTKGTEPVTGWLVCVKGDNYGKSYEIATGQNCIGRDSSMEICIKEPSISREKQAYLIYEPKKSQFFLRSGDGVGLTYLNDEMLCGMVPLNAYDRIQLGDAEFLFVPFCGEKFVWDNN